MENEQFGALQALYLEADQETAAYAAASGLGCPEGCGACCHSTEVEISLLEALLIIRDQRLRSDWPERMALVEQAREGGARICAFFEAEPGAQGDGRCGVYPVRGLVCRLFGFAGRRDSYGNREPVVCRVMRGGNSERVPEIRAMIDGGLALPVFEEYRMRVDALCNPDQARLYPVNEALWRAIGKLELQASLSS
jgi:Fe-S-cluster containining protein